MSNEQETWFDKVYAAESVSETESAYDGWAATYEADLYKAGYRGPAMVAGMLCRHLKPGSQPILEAAVGTGLVGELLRPLGYESLIGIDLSEVMLRIAARKKLYAQLRRMRLGDPLDYPDDSFAATLITGAFTPGHAGPECLAELIRVTRRGAPVIFTLRVDADAGAPFLAMQERLEEQGQWSLLERTPPMNIMPISEPDVLHSIFVYRVA